MRPKKLIIAALLVASALLTAPAAGAQEELNADVFQRIEDLKFNLEADLSRALFTLHLVDPEDDEELYAESEALRRQREAQYREALTAELTARLAGVSPSQWSGEIYAFRRETMRRWEPFLGNADEFRAGLVRNVGRLGDDARDRAELFAEAELAIRLARVGTAVADEAIRRLTPIFDTGALQSSAVARLSELRQRITRDYIEAPNQFLEIRDRDVRAVHLEVYQWHLTLLREINVSEYTQIAEGALIVDPRTRRPLADNLRRRVARNAKLVLANELRNAGVDDGLLRSFLGWGDSRESLATLIEGEVENNDWYRALDYLDPDTQETSPSELFRAFALVVQKDVDALLTWRAELIPEGGEGGVDGWLYEQFVAKQQVGLNLATMIDPSTGSVGDIDRQLAVLQAEADAVTEAFMAAASTRPGALSEAHRELLDAFGFIEDTDGQLSYVFPDGSTTARLRRDLDLPGASVLDVISGANAIKLVALLAAPQLAGARIAALLEGLEVSASAVTAAAVVTEVGVGTVVSAVDQRLTSPDGVVQWDQVLIDGLLVGPAAQSIELVGGLGARAFARYIANSPARRTLAEATITQALGLSSEAALQAYWSAASQGRDVTYDDFLANLLNGIIGRGAPAVGRGSATVADIFVRGTQNVPRWVLAGLTPNADGSMPYPELAAGLSDARRREVLGANFEAAEARFLEALGDGAGELAIGDPLLVDRVTAALETGTLTWGDLTVVFTQAPVFLTPLLQAINVRRRELFEGIVNQAQDSAAATLRGERIVRRIDVLERYAGESPDTAARDRELRDIEAWYQAELDLIYTEPIAPGSSNLTSDIDRSVASPRVRNELKRLTDEVFAGDQPATSARAYDVNEYINVFPIIDRQRARGTEIDGVSVPDSRGLDQAATRVALGYAHFMMHMTPSERAQFRDNLLERAGSPEEAATIDAQLEYAEANLDRGDAELREEILRIGADPENPSPDDVLRARDNLYGLRTLRLREWERRLGELEPGTTEHTELAALIEREWAFGLREGIEAYSDFTGLDIIVNQAQLQDRSVRDLINDDSFTAEAQGYTSEGLRGALYNQLGMIVEHAHGFHLGEENAISATAAVAKYAERALLVLKLLGRYDDSSARFFGDGLFELSPNLLEVGALDRLSEVSEQLVANRKDPDKLRELLRELGEGDAASGYRYFLEVIERAIPEAGGLFAEADVELLRELGIDVPADPAANAAGPDAATDVAAPRRDPLYRATPLQRARAEAARERDIADQLARDAHEDGLIAAIEAREALLAVLERERRDLHSRLSDSRFRGNLYRAENFDLARDLERQLDAITDQLALLPTDTLGPVYNDLVQQRNDVIGRLHTLRGRRQRLGPSPSDPLADLRVELRLLALNEEIEELRDELSELSYQASERLRRLLEAPVDGLADVPILVDSIDFSPVPGIGPFEPFEFEDALRNGYPAPPPWPSNPGELPPDGAGDSPPGGEPGEDSETDPPTDGDGAPDDDAAAGEPDDTAGREPGAGDRLRSIVPPLNYGWAPNEPDEEDAPPPFTEPPVSFDPRHDPGRLVSWPGSLDPLTQLMIIDSFEPLAPVPAAPPEGVREPRLTRTASAAVAGAEQAPTALEPGVLVVLASVGRSTGEAFTVLVANTGERAVELAADGVVVEPLDEEARDRMAAQLEGVSAAGVVQGALSAYCLQFLKSPPVAGRLFRIAPPEVQEQFAEMRSVLRSARVLHESGLLEPDSEERGYVDFIKQWSIWSREAGLDFEGFADRFVEHTRDNIQKTGGAWSASMEEQLRDAAPGRWRDIQQVLRYAEPLR